MLRTHFRSFNFARVSISIILVSFFFITACGTSGRELRSYPSGNTAPPRSTTTTVGPSSPSTTKKIENFKLTSTAWVEGKEIPIEYTCEGSSQSPPLQWANIPVGTSELALVVSSFDDPDTINWLVSKIPATSGLSVGGKFPQQSIIWPTGTGENSWVAPCPTSDSSFTYFFTLYALSKPLDLTGLNGSTEPIQIVNAIVDQSQSSTVLVGTVALHTN